MKFISILALATSASAAALNARGDWQNWSTTTVYVTSTATVTKSYTATVTSTEKYTDTITKTSTVPTTIYKTETVTVTSSKWGEWS